VHLIATLHQLKEEKDTVLVPIKEFNQLTRQLGIHRNMPA